LSSWIERNVLALALAFAAVLAPDQAGALADPRCVRIHETQGVGPFDWRDRSEEVRQMLHRVESFHFKRKHVQAALNGDSSTEAGVWNNLDYTLRAFPNHPRALMLIGVFEIQVRKFSPEAWRAVEKRPNFSPVACYFERALMRTPDDPGIYNARGIILSRVQEWDKAIEAFQRAVELAPGSAEAHYNLGLAYYGAGDYQKSAASAREAYRLGYGKSGLKQRLKRKGAW